jgi:hypothetical protein
LRVFQRQMRQTQQAQRGLRRSTNLLYRRTLTDSTCQLPTAIVDRSTVLTAPALSAAIPDLASDEILRINGAAAVS